MITFFAVLSGAAEWSKIEVFAKSKEKRLRKYLELPYGIPTDDTFRLIISNINPLHFYSMVVALLVDTMEQMLWAAEVTLPGLHPILLPLMRRKAEVQRT